jgi:hypothetical protein
LIESFSTAVSRLVLITNQNIWKRQELWNIVAASTVYKMNQMNEQRQELKEHNYKVIDKLSDAAVFNMWQLHKMLHEMDPTAHQVPGW